MPNDKKPESSASGDFLGSGGAWEFWSTVICPRCQLALSGAETDLYDQETHDLLAECPSCGHRSEKDRPWWFNAEYFEVRA